MKFLLLGLFLGLAAANLDRNTHNNEQNYPRIQEIAYRPGKEYVYQYDTQVLTGLPQTSQIQAGFRISCLARVQFNTRSKVRVVFEKIVLYRINEPVVQWKPTEHLMPEEFLKELTGDEAATMEHYLQIPFGFEYDEGQILRILLQETETSWSSNIKRGFTSLFEMNLEKRFLLDDSFPAIQSSTPPHVNWYNVFERSTTGDCATLYTVTPNSRNDHLYVTKTRDYKRCLNKPVYLNAMFDGEMTQGAQKDNPLINGATLKYNVRGNDKNFLILSVVGEGHIVLTPYKNQEQVRTSLNQTMYLKEAKQIGREVQEILEVHRGQHKKETLRMTLPSSPVDCKDPFMPCDEERKSVNDHADVYSDEKIYIHLKMAARNTQEITSEDSLQHLRIVKDMLKTSPEPILKKLWERLHMSRVNPQADIDRLGAEIYWNVLPGVGTEAAANIILDVCARDVLMTNNCTSAIRNLGLRVTPTTEIISKLIRLTGERSLTSEVRQAAFLTLGTFGYKLTRSWEKHNKQCEQAQSMIDTLMRDNNKDRTNFIQTEKRIIESRCNSILSKYQQSEEKILEVLKRLSESPRQEDKILAIKALGNSGLPRALSILKKYIENPVEANILRVMAITAHRRMYYPETSRQQAIKTLLKLYLTTTEKSEIRQFAFLIMSNLKPERSVYETVAISLRQEKDAQLSGFIYSYFTTFSNSTYWPDWEIKQNMTAALKFAPEIQNGLDQSFMKKFGLFSEDYKRGGALSLTSVGDISRFLGYALNLDSYNYGMVSKMVEVGINTEGLSPFINKMFGPRGLLTYNKSLFDLLKRGPRDISPQETISRIFSTLRIQDRSMPTPYGHLYYKVMGHELGYLDFTTLLRSISTTGMYPVNFNEEGLRVGIPLTLNTMYDIEDAKFTLPTEAGLPISLRVQAQTSVNMEGSLIFKVTPYMMESDRQGQPPIAIQAKIDLTPKIAVELQCSMGLDMFYVKPTVGYRGLIKYDAPIKNELKVDLTYKRLNLKFFNPVQEKPAIEMLLEPFSEFMLISKRNESPVFVLQRNNIFAPSGTRVLPISQLYNLNALGYKLAITGQLPYCLSKSNPIRPLNGRSLINIFWKPMENAPSTFTLHAQNIWPIREAVANSYAQTYQDVLTTRPEQYGTDFSRIENSGVMRFDRFGRPLPQSTEEILPYSDPVDIENTPVNMQQMCNKFQQIFNKPMPFYNIEGARGLVILLDASTNDIKRQLQLETVWNYFKSGHIGRMFTRMWRSPIPNYDTQEWQMLSEMGVSYPFEVKEPKDIFDPKWQRELMKDLEYLISLETHKVVNQGINMTILSNLEQFNYPSMIRIPTYRVLDSLVPEQLYRLMNMTGSTIYNRRWDSYWHHLAPIYHKVSEELKINVDPNFVNRDLPLMDYVNQILKVQEEFLADMNDIVSKTIVAHAELPIIQWIDYTQAKTVYMIREVFNKALLMDRLQEADNIHTVLIRAEANVDSLVTLMDRLMQTVTAVSQRLDQNGNPVVVFKPEVLRQTSNHANLMYAFQRANMEYEQEPRIEHPHPSYYTTQDSEQDRQFRQQTYYSLRMSLYSLSLMQMDFIKKLQLSISNVREFTFPELTLLLQHIRDNLNIVDNVLMRRPISDPVAKQSLLMITVQNEFTIELLEQWKRIVAEKLNMKASVEKMELFSSKLEQLKEHGVFLGERIALLYHRDLLVRVVVPNLNQHEYPIYQQIIDTKRVMVPEYREFHRLMAYNETNMKQPEMVVAHFDKLNERLTTHANKIAEIERALIQLGTVPKVYLMSELMDALHYLKYTTEFGSRTLYSINDQRRFTYLENLGETATKIQSLISALSPIFGKYEQYNSELNSSNYVSILNTMPVDTRVLDVQDVIVQQKMLKEQLRRFIQNPDVSSEVLSQVLTTAVDRCEVLQETLKQNQVQVQSALQQSSIFKRQAVSALWTEALNEQRFLYESLLNMYNTNRDTLRDVIRSTDRINALEMEIVNMETQHTQIQQSIPEHTLNDENTWTSEDDSQTLFNQQPRQQRMQPLTPFEYQPNGLTALWNFTWGNGHELNKNAKVQFMASRSVEQIMYLFSQMNSVLRSQDVVNAVNRRLGDEPWLADSVMQKMNTFNHWHFIAQAQQENLPQMMMDKLRYVQDFFKATFWNQYRRQPASQVVSENQFQAMIDISDINKQFDLYVLNNAETNIYQGLKMWRFAQGFPVIQTYKPLKEKVMSYMSYNRKPTKCMVNKDKVYTFDNVNYQLPYLMGQKEALLAADCSNEKTFALTMIKSNTSFNGHIVKILNEDKIVEVIPGYLNTEVKVNGRVIVLDESRPVVFSKKLTYDLYQPSLKIVRKGWRIEVTFPLTGLEFLMEGTFMQLKVSEIYKRRMCGLCSNFDSQMSWEFEGPRNEIYSSPKLFSQSYILREQDRHSFNPNMPEFTVQHDKYYNVVSQYRPKGDAGRYPAEDEDKKVIVDQWKIEGHKTHQHVKAERKIEIPVTQDSDESKDACAPVLETVMKAKRRRGQLCFSQLPVYKCPSACPKAAQEIRRSVPFVCLSVRDPETRRLSRQVSYGPIPNILDKEGNKATKFVKEAIVCEIADLDN